MRVKYALKSARLEKKNVKLQIWNLSFTLNSESVGRFAPNHGGTAFMRLALTCIETEKD